MRGFQKTLHSSVIGRLPNIVLLAAIVGLLWFFQSNLRGFYLDVVILTGINSIICLGVLVTNSYANLFSLGFGGTMLMAAYTTALLTLPVWYKAEFLHLPKWLESAQLPFPLSLLLAGLMAVLASTFLVLPAFRLRGHYFILASMGINVIMANLGINLKSFTHGPLGLRNIPFFTNIWWVYGILIGVVIFIYRLMQSKYGRALIALGKDQTLASALGINIVRYKIYAFVIGSFITGIGGALWVHYIGAMHPNVFDFTFVFQIIAMITIGGSGSISGTLLGATVLTLFTLLARPVQEGFSIFGVRVPPLIGLIQILLAIILIITIIYRPQGILNGYEITWKNIKHVYKLLRKR